MITSHNMIASSRGSQRQGKFSAWAARTEAVLVKELAAAKRTA